jgi:hypothetical protein
MIEIARWNTSMTVMKSVAIFAERNGLVEFGCKYIRMIEIARWNTSTMVMKSVVIFTERNGLVEAQCVCMSKRSIASNKKSP